MLNAITDPALWQEFLEYKREHGHLSKKDLEVWEKFVAQQGYLSVGQTIQEGSTFAPPRKSEISKMHSEKKTGRLCLFRC